MNDHTALLGQLFQKRKEIKVVSKMEIEPLSQGENFPNGKERGSKKSC